MNAPPDLHWLAALRARLEAIDPEIVTDERLLFDTLDGQSDVIDKLRAIMRHGLEAAVFAEALSRHVDTLETRRRRLQAREDACRATVREAMEAIGIKSLASEDFTARIVAGRPAVQIISADVLPEAFIRTKREPNISAISEALKAGEDAPGACFNNPIPILTVRRL